MDTRAWRRLTSLEPSRLRGQCPLGSSGISRRKQGQEGQSNYLGWVLLPALVICSFDRVGDCMRTIQALWGQKPSHRQDEDVGWPGEHYLVMPGAPPAQHSEKWRPEPVLHLTGSPPGWVQAPHWKKLLKLDRVWLCLQSRAWLSGTSLANKESFIFL